MLDAIRDERLQQNAKAVGEHLRRRLLELARRHTVIGAVHGHGLYLGVELIADHQTLEPATRATAAICERMLDPGGIVQPTSDRLNVLKVKPPMCIDAASVDFFVDALDHVLAHGF